MEMCSSAWMASEPAETAARVGGHRCGAAEPYVKSNPPPYMCMRACAGPGLLFSERRGDTRGTAAIPPLTGGTWLTPFGLYMYM